MSDIYIASPWQAKFHSLTQHEALGAGAAGPGKALAVDTPIPTARGLVPMGELVVGDTLFDERGATCRVVFATEVMREHECYEVCFDDGATIVADAEHLWFTCDYRERESRLRAERRAGRRTGLNDQRQKARLPRTRTTQELAATLSHLGRKNHAVDVAGALMLPPAELPMDPYALGVWLGDGSSGGAVVYSNDEEIISELRSLGYEVKKRRDAFAYGVGSGFCSQLRGLGLLPKGRFVTGSSKKHIPERYFLASAAQRLALLQGLLDTDGHIDADGRVELTLCREQLAVGAYRLVCSLGFKATMRASPAVLNGREVGTRYRIGWSPRGVPVCRLARKLAKVGNGSRTQRWRYVVDVRPVPSVPVRCIQVDSPSHLYLAGVECIPTHNTTCLLAEPLQYLTVEMARLERNPRLATSDPRSRLWDLIERNPIDEGQSVGEFLYLRRTFPQLEQTIDKARRLYRAVDPYVEYNGETHTFRFPATGFKAKFGHCHKASDWENYMSNEYVGVAFDELVQFEQNQYEQIKNRCRTTDPVLKFLLKIRSMSNPVMRSEGADALVLSDPQWVRRYFVDVYHQEGKEYGETITKTETGRDGKEFKRTRVYLPAKLSDNPNKEFVEMETEKLMHALPHIRRALLEGDWYVVQGAFFSDIWDPSIHVFRAFRIPKDWPVFRSMDWGFKTNGVIGWFAVDPDGNLLCIKDLVFRLKHPEQVAEDIKDIEAALGIPWGPNGSRITGPADTQLWEERGEKGLSKAAEFAAAGVPWVQADKKSRRRNAERVSTRLNDHEGGTTHPGLAFASVCLACIQCVPSIGTDPTDAETPMKGGNDHPYDMIAYACAYASHGLPSLAAPSDDDDEQVDDGPSGQYGYGAY